MVRSTKTLLAVPVFIGFALSLSGCLGVPFHVAGDILDATGDVVGSVASVPFDVAGSIVDIPDSHRAEYSEEDSRTLIQGDIAYIDLTIRNGSVRIRGTDSDQISIHYTKRIHARTHSAAENYADEVFLNMDKDGNQLRVYQSPQHRKNNKYYVNICIDMEIPEYMDLNIHAGNAGLDIGGLCGDMRFVTDNGNIQANGLHGAVYAETDNGRIEIRMNELAGKSRFISDNGSVDVRIEEISAPVSIETDNGSVHLALPETFEGYMDARTDNGSIDSDFPVYVHTSRRHQLDGKIGSGHGPEINIRTNNGGIHLDKI